MSKKEKAQVNSGFTSGVYNADTSGCIALGGNLRKKNSHGVWQKRYFYLNNEFLIYKKDNSATEIKGAVDVGNADTFEANSKGDLTIYMIGGEKLELKGTDTRDVGRWVAALEERKQWVLAERELIQRATAEVAASTDHTDTTPMAEKSGWLMKKSNNKYGGMQERYVKLANNFFRYFKQSSDPDSAALGSVSLETADWVRPYDSTADCKTFELQAQQRVYLFVAESPGEMKAWITSVNSAISSAKAILEGVAKARETAATPYRIRIYDEKGADALSNAVEADLEEIFPYPVPPAPRGPDEEEDEEGEERVATVADHISLAWQVVDYIEDLLPEVAKTTGPRQRPARLDVLAVCLLKINSFLNGRLTPVMNPNLMDTTKLQLGDVHSVINWLNNYQLMMRDIYCPPLGPDAPVPTSFSLFSQIPALCEMYIKGAKGLQGAQNYLVTHANKVWETLVNDPSEVVETRQDGTFYTHAPTDMWELFHHHLSLATSTSSPILCFMVAETIVGAITSIIGLIRDYVEKMNRPEVTGSFRDIELELLCAFANDIALHFEELEAVVDKFNLEEIRRKVDELFDVVADNLVHCGQACLRRLSALIMEDIGDNLQEIYTPAWLGVPPPTEPPTKPSNQISVVIATVNDYLVDMKDYLVPFWLQRLNNCVLEALVTRYFKSVMKIDQAASSPTKPKEAAKTNKRESKMVPSFLKKGSMELKSMVDKIVVAGLRADENAVALINNDRNAILQYFDSKTDRLADYVAILDDLSHMLSDEPDELSRLLMSRINQCPPAAQAIIEAANRCAAMRDDLSDDDKEMIFVPLEPILQVHSQLGGESEITAVSQENRTLCGLYCNIGLQQKKSLSSKLLNMTYLPISKGKGGQGLRDIAPPPMKEEKMMQYRDSDIGRMSNVEDVLSALKEDDAEYLAMLKAEEEADQQAIEMEQQAIAAGKAALNLEGPMEKKSPAHNLWQTRWFKLTTRVNESETGDGFTYTHTIFWYKKKGGSVLKALDAKAICGMQLLSSPRSLAYLTDDFNIHLAHDPEGLRGVPVKEWDAESDGSVAVGAAGLLSQSHGQAYSFTLQLDSAEVQGGKKAGSGGEKDVILRVDGVDTLIKWMNAIGSAAKLEYDIPSGVWIKGDRKKKINPKAILKYSSMPQDGSAGKRPSVIPRSMSAMPTSTSSSAASHHTHSSLQAADSFEEGLMEEEEEDDDNEAEEEGEVQEEAEEASRAALHLEGQLEKKSPAHNLWQARWFKIVTRVGTADEGTSYTLHWYKKRGAVALKSINTDAIISMTLLFSAKPVVYSADDMNIHLLVGDANKQNGISVRESGAESSGFCFLLALDSSEVKGGKKTGGDSKDKDVILRAESIEKLINWMNCIAEAAGLEYDSAAGLWVKGPRVKRSNPKTLSKSSTMPVGNQVHDTQGVILRSSSALPTLSSSSAAAVIDEEEEREEEEDTPFDDDAPMSTSRALSNESTGSGSVSSAGGLSPKKLLLANRDSEGSANSPSQLTSSNISKSPMHGEVDEGVGERNSGGSAKSPMHQVKESHTGATGESDEEDQGIIDISQIVLPSGSKNYDSRHIERESDIYSVHSEDIQEHHQHEETDDELTGDGSKPVGCTSCTIM